MTPPFATAIERTVETSIGLLVKVRDRRQAAAALSPIINKGGTRTTNLCSSTDTGAGNLNIYEMITKAQ